MATRDQQSALGAHINEHVILGTLTPDATGNFSANVNHRTGTLASLITLTGGDGEIGVATDYQALVKYNGIANQAKVFFRGSGPIGTIILKTTGNQSIPTGVSTPVTMQSMTTRGYVPPEVTFDSVNSAINIASGDLTIATKYVIEISSQISFVGVATPGIYRRVTPAFSLDGANWFPIGSKVDPAITGQAQIIEAKFSLANNYSPLANTKYRVEAQQDSGGAVFLASDGGNTYLKIDIYAGLIG